MPIIDTSDDSNGLHDLSPMPFGKYKGMIMQDVPASYLHWLWTQGCSNPSVKAYIKKSLSALEQENPDLIW